MAAVTCPLLAALIPVLGREHELLAEQKRVVASIEACFVAHAALASRITPALLHRVRYASDVGAATLNPADAVIAQENVRLVVAIDAVRESQAVRNARHTAAVDAARRFRTERARADARSAAMAERRRGLRGLILRARTMRALRP
jgi:hypothetical protein